MDCHANGQRVIFFTRACGIFAGAASRRSLCSGNDGMRLNKKSLLAFAILQWVYAKKSYFTTSTATLILMMLSMLAIIIGGILCALAVYNIKRAPSYSDSNEVLKEARSYAIVAVFLSLAIFTLILAYLVVINQAPLDT